jgi:hypothetical protein
VYNELQAINLTLHYDLSIGIQCVFERNINEDNNSNLNTGHCSFYKNNNIHISIFKEMVLSICVLKEKGGHARKLI